MAAIAHGVGALLFVDMAHIAGLVAAGRPPEPVPARRHRHDHDPQDAPRAARRADLQPARAAADASTAPTSRSVKTTLAATIDKTRLPGRPGRAADARHRGQGRRASSWPRATSSGATSGGRSRTPRRSPRRLAERGLRRRLGRHRQPPDARRRDAAGVTGKEAEHLLDEIGITVNKNAHPVRPAAAQHVVRYPDRDAGHDDPRLRRRTRCATSAGSSSRRSVGATNPRPRVVSPPRSPRSSPGSRFPASPRSDELHPGCRGDRPGAPRGVRVRGAPRARPDARRPSVLEGVRAGRSTRSQAGQPPSDPAGRRDRRRRRLPDRRDRRRHPRRSAGDPGSVHPRVGRSAGARRPARRRPGRGRDRLPRRRPPAPGALAARRPDRRRARRRSRSESRSTSIANPFGPGQIPLGDAFGVGLHASSGSSG